jgi:hypothetical protein
MKHTYIILLVAGFSLSLQAQTAKKDTTGLNRVLNLEKEYNPTLQDASKISQLPEIKEPEVPKSKVEFSNYTLPYSISPYINLINPNAYLTNPATSQQKGYLNFGLGTLLNINGDAGYQLLNTKEDYLSVFASHRSSNSKAHYLQKDSYAYKNQKMKINDNLIGANYNHTFEGVTLFTDAQYTYSGFNYYGAPVRELFSEDINLINSEQVPTQTNHLFGIHAGVKSVDNTDIEYKANVGYRLFKENNKIFTEKQKGRTENQLLADADFHTYFNSIAGVGVGGYLINYSYNTPDEWKYYSKYNVLEEDNNNHDYTTLSLNPYFTFERDNWKARVGATVNGQFGGVKEFILAPDIRFDWHPFQDKLLIYLSAVGGIQDNSNYSLFHENRYVYPIYRVKDSRSPFDGTVGIQYLVIPNLSLEAFTGFKLTKDEHFFSPFSEMHSIDDILTAHQWMVPSYEKTQTIKVGGAIKYAYQDLVDVRLKASYYKWKFFDYGMDEKYVDLELGQKPTFESDFSIGVKPIPQLKLDLRYHLETGRKAEVFTYFYKGVTPTSTSVSVFSGSTQKMKDIHDLSLTGTYTINKTISVYLTVNNLLFQKYDIWYGYPAQNFNIMGGINVKF